MHPLAENECVFCRIVQHRAPTQIVYQDDLVTAFESNRPLTPVHLLVVPNRHFTSLNDVQSEDERIMGRLLTLANQLARQFGIDHSGYRLVINTGPDGGQTVFHLHLHLLGGRKLRVEI